MSTARAGYHHGDLRAALVEAGLEVTRTGGAAALGLREVTRAVGVTPNAAYRHFDGLAGLTLAVAVAAQEQLARRILRHVESVPDDLPPAERAVERLRGVGRGYIDFAVGEPGWFDLAITTTDGPEAGDGAVTVGGEVPHPYRLLLDALDDLVTTGALPAERRPHAEWVCWSSVHGFAALASHGPLAGHDRQVVDALTEHVVRTVVASL